MSAEGYRVPEPGYRDYVRPFPNTWWLKNRPYFLFMLRELTSVFVLVFSVRLLTGVIALSRGEAAWNKWLAEATEYPFMAITGALVFFFIFFHSVTWFQSAAVVTPVEFGKFKVPTTMYVLGNICVLIIVAAIIGYFSLGG